MSLKNLPQFERFDIQSFLQDKKLEVTEIKSWLDNDTHKTLGTKVEVAIVQDSTTYEASRDGTVRDNLYEKLIIKVNKMSLPISKHDIVTVKNPVARIYGDYRNQLSITADDVVIVKSVEDKK